MPGPVRAGEVAEPADLRLPWLGVVAWLSALAGVRLSARVDLAVALVLCGLVLLGLRRRGLSWHHLAWLLVALAVGGGALLRVGAVQAGPLPGLARDAATAHVRVQLSGDPALRHGRFSSYVLVRATLHMVRARGHSWRIDQPVLLVAPPSWARVRLGEQVLATGRLAPAQDNDLAAVLLLRGSPVVVARDGPMLRAAAQVRHGIRAAVRSRPSDQRALVPALVDGDDTGLPSPVKTEFRVSGLTHLLAVSGTNLTLLVGALLVVARGLGVRARGLIVVGALGVAGFVLLARAEPSVLRAAAMGSVALIGMGSNGRQRGGRSLGAAVLVLMLFDPWLAADVGFALSALATAGIIFLAPGWRDALARWLPRWVAEALAVPTAAQLACTPVVAAISGQVSLVAVAANLLAAPAVGPATVFGLIGGLFSACRAALGMPFGVLAGWCGWWILTVAHHSAALPTAAVAWPVSTVSLVVLTLLCGWLAVTLGAVLARRVATLVLAGLAVMVTLVPVPTPGWPPQGWVLVACDVGQGDGLVLNAGSHAAVVVDTGPDPGLMDSCLRRLRVTRVPLVILTHFHADHVDGLPGVLRGRQVGGIEVTTLADPLAGSRAVRAEAGDAGVPVRLVRLGERGSVGPLRWEALAPSGPPPADSDSPPNDASIVLIVVVRGVRILLMGDEETGSQRRLATLVAGLHVDVLKVAHHGSSKQDPDLVRGLHARLALISVGLHNDYGHPARATLELLRSAGIRVGRTDRDGDLAVVAGGGSLRLVGRQPGGPSP